MIITATTHLPKSFACLLDENIATLENELYIAHKETKQKQHKQKMIDTDVKLIELAAFFGYEFEPDKPRMPYQYYENIGCKRFFVQYDNKCCYMYGFDIDHIKTQLNQNQKTTLQEVTKL